jgi:hypothetical protein
LNQVSFVGTGSAAISAGVGVAVRVAGIGVFVGTGMSGGGTGAGMAVGEGSVVGAWVGGTGVVLADDPQPATRTRIVSKIIVPEQRLIILVSSIHSFE